MARRQGPKVIPNPSGWYSGPYSGILSYEIEFFLQKKSRKNKALVVPRGTVDLQSASIRGKGYARIFAATDEEAMQKTELLPALHPPISEALPWKGAKLVGKESNSVSDDLLVSLIAEELSSRQLESAVYVTEEPGFEIWFADESPLHVLPSILETVGASLSDFFVQEPEILEDRRPVAGLSYLRWARQRRWVNSMECPKCGSSIPRKKRKCPECKTSVAAGIKS